LICSTSFFSFSTDTLGFFDLTQVMSFALPSLFVSNATVAFRIGFLLSVAC
jgi:hypothetical protein